MILNLLLFITCGSLVFALKLFSLFLINISNLRIQEFQLVYNCTKPLNTLVLPIVDFIVDCINMMLNIVRKQYVPYRYKKLTMATCSDCMSLVMRKPAFCICENKDADQLRSNCADRFVSDLIENPEDRFSHNEAHMTDNDVITDQAIDHLGSTDS